MRRQKLVFQCFCLEILSARCVSTPVSLCSCSSENASKVEVEAFQSS